MLGFVGLTVFFICTSVAAGSSCKFDEGLASFDLTNLVNSNPEVTITDGDIAFTLNIEQNHSYAVAVCGTVSNRPAVCADDGTASCFQYDEELGGGGDCHRCGDYNSDAGINKIRKAGTDEQLTWAAGFEMEYSGGSQCRHDSQGRVTSSGPFRKTKLVLECANVNYARPEHALEYNHCEYTVHIKSFWACPVQCPVAAPQSGGTSQLCAGHGHCGWDETNQYPKCFCDDGWTGNDCGKAGDTADGGSSGTIIGLLAVTFVVVLLLLAFLAYLVKQIRAYRTDATNYMAIRGNELVGNQEI